MQQQRHKIPTIDFCLIRISFRPYVYAQKDPEGPLNCIAVTWANYHKKNWNWSFELLCCVLAKESTEDYFDLCSAGKKENYRARFCAMCLDSRSVCASPSFVCDEWMLEQKENFSNWNSISSSPVFDERNHFTIHSLSCTKILLLCFILHNKSFNNVDHMKDEMESLRCLLPHNFLFDILHPFICIHQILLRWKDLMSSFEIYLIRIVDVFVLLSASQTGRERNARSGLIIN